MKILFVVQDFESKSFEDSAGNIELVKPMLQSGLISDRQIINFGLNQQDHDQIVATRLKALETILQDSAIVVYGAGAHTARYIKLLKTFNIVALADKDEALLGQNRFGFPIIAPSDIMNYADHVIISSKAWESSIQYDLNNLFGAHLATYSLFDGNLRTQQILECAKEQITNSLKSFNPDILLYSSAHPADRIPAAFFKKMKKKHPRLKLVNIWWDYDESAQGNSHLSHEQEILSYSDFVIENSNATRIQRMRANQPPYQTHNNTKVIHFHPTIFDNETFHPRKTPQDIDVAIFGNPLGNRREWIAYLTEHLGGKFRHIGGSENPNGYLSISDYAQLISRVKIVINTQSFSFSPQCKGKVREALCSQAFLLEEDNPETRHFVPEGRGLIYFHDKADLLSKIQYYLIHENERNDIARAGYQWIKSKYNSTIWTKYILDQLELE